QPGGTVGGDVGDRAHPPARVLPAAPRPARRPAPPARARPARELVVTDRTATGGIDDAAPVFVVGSMRSGSTLLRLMLDSHPRIAIGAETGFMGAAMGTKRIPGWKYGAEWYQRINWSEAEVDQRLRDFY